MYFCYLDESGTPENAGTSHYVFLGLAIPAEQWKVFDCQVAEVKARFQLEGAEIHTAWLMRRYLEQERITDFERMDRDQRLSAVKREREAILLRTAALRPDALKGVQKTLRKTAPYTHLTLQQRKELVSQVAQAVARMSDARIFADAIEKANYPAHFPPISEQAFEQVVTRFETFLQHRARWFIEHKKPAEADRLLGLLIQDNNPTVNSRLTGLMRKFHQRGTLFRTINRIIETPLFVDSKLTSMIQVADVCAYAVRRFVENGETELLDQIYPRFDRVKNTLVGVRHFTAAKSCNCMICKDHCGIGPMWKESTT